MKSVLRELFIPVSYMKDKGIWLAGKQKSDSEKVIHNLTSFLAPLLPPSPFSSLQNRPVKTPPKTPYQKLTLSGLFWSCWFGHLVFPAPPPPPLWGGGGAERKKKKEKTHLISTPKILKYIMEVAKQHLESGRTVFFYPGAWPNPRTIGLLQENEQIFPHPFWQYLYHEWHCHRWWYFCLWSYLTRKLIMLELKGKCLAHSQKVNSNRSFRAFEMCWS